MASLQGFGGTATFNGSTVAQIQRWEVTASQDIIDYTSMGDRWRKRQGGLAEWSGRIDVVYEKLTGQLGMTDSLIAATPTSSAVTCVFQLASGKTFTGSAIVARISVSGDKADKFDASFELMGDGELTDAWA